MDERIEYDDCPLGNGVATSVGMAMAGQVAAAHYKQADFEMFN